MEREGNREQAKAQELLEGEEERERGGAGMKKGRERGRENTSKVQERRDEE